MRTSLAGRGRARPPRNSRPANCAPVLMGLMTWRLVGRLADLGAADVSSVSHPGRVGEGRACWSLGNAYVSMGSPAQALTFAKKHLEISQEVSQARPAVGPQALPSPPQTRPGPSVRPGTSPTLLHSF